MTLNIDWTQFLSDSLIMILGILISIILTIIFSIKNRKTMYNIDLHKETRSDLHSLHSRILEIHNFTLTVFLNPSKKNILEHNRNIFEKTQELNKLYQTYKIYLSKLNKYKDSINRLYQLREDLVLLSKDNKISGDLDKMYFDYNVVSLGVLKAICTSMLNNLNAALYKFYRVKCKTNNEIVVKNDD